MGINLTHMQDEAASQPSAMVRPDAAPVLDSAALQPLLAGARARGMADAFDLLGQAVILIDRAGMALHVNSVARNFLGADLALTHRHLVARDAATTCALQAMISAALEQRSGRASVAINRTAGQGRIIVTIMPVAQVGADSCQLLKAIIMIREDNEFVGDQLLDAGCEGEKGMPLPQVAEN